MPFNALIRTHHITSRKKVSALKRAAETYNCFALLRSGGCPGIMYVEADNKPAVESWVGAVRNLRYKDFQLVNRPAELRVVGGDLDTSGDAKKALEESRRTREDTGLRAGLLEVHTVKEFTRAMERRGVREWCRQGMGWGGGT